MFNPFVVGKYISEEYFCDRKKETALLEQHIFNGLNVVLYAPRRMGKTGLIHHLFRQEEIKDNYYCIFFDAYPTNSLAELTFWLSKAVFSQVAQSKKNLLKKFVDTIRSVKLQFNLDETGLPNLSLSLGEIKQPTQTTEEIFSYLDTLDKPVVLAIDEFQQISNYPEKNIEAILRSCAQKVKKVNLIYSGSRHHLLNEIFLDANKPFFQSAVYLNLGKIPEEEYVRFAQRLFFENEKLIEKKVISDVYNKFDGVSWFVQFTMNQLFSITKKKQNCTKDFIPQALSNIIGFNEESYKQMLSTLSEKDRALLFALLDAGKTKSLYSAEFITKYYLGTASNVQRSKQNLEEKGILAAGDDGYFIFDFFFAEWLRRL